MSNVILVVEDDALIRMGAVAIVETAGYEAIEASNADEAIKVLELRGDIRVVFTDVDMPGSMDGLRLAKYIRERWPPVLLIVASGKAIIHEGELPPGALYFSKPYEEHTIAESIRNLLGSPDPFTSK
jgi:CheY-like chemotaxis protein